MNSMFRHIGENFEVGRSAVFCLCYKKIPSKCRGKYLLFTF